MLYNLLENNKHTHLLFFSDFLNAGVSSVENNHKHMLVPNETGVLQVTSAEDGHIHEFKEYVIKDNKVNEKKEDEVVVEQIRLFQESCDFMEEVIEEAIEDEEFYHHKQWDDEILSKLDSEEKAHATINHIEPMMDVLTGHQRQNRTDFNFSPVEEGDQVIADVLNVVTKVITTVNSFEAEETRVFEDMASVGLGLFNMYIDYSKNMKGEIKIERFPWREVKFGPHENPDLRDCEYLFKCKWFSKAKLKQLYPEEYEKLVPDNIDGERSIDGRNISSTLMWEDASGKPYGASKILGNPELYDNQRKNYRVLERWQKEFRNVPVLAFMSTEETENLYGMNKKDIKRLETIEGVKVFYKETHRIRIIKTAGNVLLEDTYPELAVQEFHIIPVFGKHYCIEGKLGFNGKIRGAKDPQKVINKNYSQIIDNGNRVNNHILCYDDNTFGGDTRLETEFKMKGTNPGHIQKVRDIKNIPVALPAPPINSASVQSLELSVSIFKHTSNVNPEMYGQTSNASSGRAIMMRKQGAMTGNEYLYDNLSLAKKMIGKLLVAMIQKIYTPERLVRIVENKYNSEALKGGQADPEMFKYPPQELVALLEEADLTVYDIAVSESPYSATNRQYIYWALVEAGQNGAPIPPTMLIKYSEMTERDKQEAIQMIQAQQMAEQQQEQQKNQTEIAKTLISANSKAQSRNNQ